MGTVLGVILGICLSAIVGWFVWRRERRKLKKSSEGREEGGDADTELRGMQQRGGGVVRQAEADEDGEVPPAYHEVVKDSRDIHV